MSEPTAGDRIDEYELGELLARSGMAAIFKARDDATGAIVALKLPHFDYESDPGFAERFRREEEVGQRLDHPNVVRILRTREKSRPYLAMEYVEGRSLRTLLREGAAPMPAARALHLARQLADALAHLAANGVVHRDLKPENVLVGAGDRVKLIDFGIALLGSEPPVVSAGLLQTVGTPDYMAPEQIRGRCGDARTDVYALGTVLYELLTAHRPFELADPRALFRAKTHDDPTPPSRWLPGLDPSLEAILLRAIARDPRDRYASAAELRRDLEDPSAIAPRRPRTARRRGLALALAAAAAAIAAALLALARVLLAGR